VNVAALVFALVVSVVTGLVCGVVPAVHAWRQDAARELQQHGRTVASARARQLLVGVETALGAALLASSALLLHSFVNVMRADRGYQIERVLAVDLSLFGPRYGGGRGVVFYRELGERVRSLPGVVSAGAISDLPAVAVASGASRTILFESDVNAQQVMLSRPVATIRSVTTGYFAASGTALRAGRVFRDDEPQLAAVISEGLVHRLWPQDSAAAVLGRRIHQGDGRLITIVGVVEDVRPGAVDRDPAPVVYRPHPQWASGPMTLVVRTAQEPGALASAVRAEIRKMDPQLPIAAVRTLRDIVSDAVAPRRFQMVLTSLFAVVALLLTAIGLYGVVSYAVAARTREIGIRVALGARRRDVMRWVFASGMQPVLAGLIVGLAGAVAIAHTLRALLFGVTPADPLSLASVAAVLLLTSCLACYLPARRAATLDPTTALRHE
jgi:putative ABC transport system permease protein